MFVNVLWHYAWANEAASRANETASRASESASKAIEVISEYMKQP
jgi:hypothetical protein